MTQTDKLAMMANQIAQFFRSYPHDEAVAGIAHHIDAFWTPKMREALATGLDDAHRLDALVREALSLGQATGDGCPVDRAPAGPGRVGDAGVVDAG